MLKLIGKWLMFLKAMKNYFQAGNKICFTKLSISGAGFFFGFVFVFSFSPKNKVLVFIASIGWLTFL